MARECKACGAKKHQVITEAVHRKVDESSQILHGGRYSYYPFNGAGLESAHQPLQAAPFQKGSSEQLKILCILHTSQKPQGTRREIRALKVPDQSIPRVS